MCHNRTVLSIDEESKYCRNKNMELKNAEIVETKINS